MSDLMHRFVKIGDLLPIHTYIRHQPQNRVQAVLVTYRNTRAMNREIQREHCT